MSYERRQYGTVFLGLAFALLLLVVGFLAFSGELLPALVAATFLVLLMACFSWLTVRVSSQSVDLVFGLGWVKRSIPIKRIVAADVVQNKWWYGWGIRLTPHGWMWNIAGKDAVELLYADGKAFRVGTDDPQGLKKAIDAQLASRR